MKNTIILLISIFLFACSGEQNSQEQPSQEQTVDPSIVNNPATASSSGNKNDMAPVMTFDKESHDFGKISQGEKVSYAFHFKNTGKSDLLIRSANGSCGCTVPEFPKDPVKPGEDGYIKVTFDSEGRSGVQTKTVTIISNTIPNTKTITITSEVAERDK